MAVEEPESQGGKPSDLAAWWPEIEGDLLATALFWTRSRDRAEDLLQDVALIVFQVRPAGLPGANDLKRWAATRIRWLALDSFRLQKRRRKHIRADSEAHRADQPIGPSQDSELLVKAVEDALARLPDRQRIVLSKTILGHSSAEIAHQLGITESTVRSLRRFARARIAAQVNEGSSE